MARRKDHPFRAIFRTDQFGWQSFGKESKGVGHIGAFHKGYTEDVPNRFPNELVSAKIAEAIRLPIPPSSMSYFGRQEGVDLASQFLFSSLDFNYEREVSPLPDFDSCIAANAHLCTGVLLFDILIANPDRTKDNFWCDNPVAPTRFLIFDHDQALLGDVNAGIDRLNGLENGLGLRYWSTSNNDYHPFLRRVTDFELFHDWFNRIFSISPWFVRDVCDEARKFGLGSAESKRLCEFINHRRKQLEEIVLKHKAEFTEIGAWTKGLF